MNALKEEKNNRYPKPGRSKDDLNAIEPTAFQLGEFDPGNPQHEAAFISYNKGEPLPIKKGGAIKM